VSDDPSRHDAAPDDPSGRVPVPVSVRGVEVDAETRCAHYDTARDVVAIRFPCCDVFYSCLDCHAAVADHPPDRWPRDRLDEPAVLCGACGSHLAATTYLDLLGVTVDGTDERSGTGRPGPDADTDTDADTDADVMVGATPATDGDDPDGGDRDAPTPRCPDCGAAFNPGCAGHVDRYFALDDRSDA
jgi:uncharacterized CHY-type Zn-finger protein